MTLIAVMDALVIMAVFFIMAVIVIMAVMAIITVMTAMTGNALLPIITCLHCLEACPRKLFELCE